ncbi:MAG: hypothetical protein IK008_01315 [Bacteroidales bacterium]|nr:hypothetical protein [Bacteroidales bacterium]
MKKRKVYQDAVTHCYQRTVNGMLIFYTVSDYLLYLTIYCITAVKYRIRILKLVQMPDHIHETVIELQAGHLSGFHRECHSRFAREYNKLCNRDGPLFEHHYGSATKFDDKRVRTNLLYLDNNPVERHLSKKAEEYRWNYLAYGNSPHPFSEKIVLRRASMSLRHALKEVKAIHAASRPLPYSTLQRFFRSLPDDREREQLIDYIVATYSVIDHQAAIRFFGSYEEELIAAHAASGSEYDVGEVFVGQSDDCYLKMIGILRRESRYKDDIHEIFALSPEEKRELYNLLRSATSYPYRQIAKFLHLAVNDSGVVVFN